MLEDYNAYKKENPKPRKNLIKLVKHMNMLNLTANENSWEYIFFDRQLTNEQIDLLLKMKLRKPYYVKDLTKLTGKDLVATAKLVDDICHVGILEYCSAPDGEDMYNYQYLLLEQWNNCYDKRKIRCFSRNGTSIFKLCFRFTKEDF
mgnify:CR=1 FL=1